VNAEVSLTLGEGRVRRIQANMYAFSQKKRVEVKGS
jgi:hypothetical protein